MPVEELDPTSKSAVSISSISSFEGKSAASSLPWAITNSVTSGRPLHETLIVDPGVIPVARPPLGTPLKEHVAV